MKKTLIATTMLVATAGVAAAEVTISGYGRFGAQYVEDRGVGLSDTIISSRLRFNVDATTETDAGVTFGARLRFQNDDGDTQTVGNNAKFSASFSGFTVSVGNVDTAFDSVALTYDSEMGYEDSSFGDSQASFFAYASKAIPAGAAGYMGVAATYSFGDANFYFSYVNPDQRVSTLPVGTNEEVGLAFDYSVGQFKIAAAYTADAAGIADNDIAFLGAAYAISDVANVGLNYYDNGTIAGVDVGDQVTLYGNYTFGATTVRAYASDLEGASNTAFGIGADYALGEGTRLSGSIQSGFASETVADLGVRFNF
ncbi:porin [Paragemmobacter ruber]|uniref:Porin n=1 Tax=Paragemmobacter ruber TaxID=1985673 RepID=A0ABW9Y3Q9_9RHOB|nr:porin [Rhodobacter ruber]NBE07165.1 porin [Rhodobacter ruber]